MTAKKTTKDLTPSPLLDSSGNPSAVAAGQIIESAWGNSVAGRVVNRYPSLAALNAVTATDGTLAVVLGIVYMRDGGAWKPTGAGRTISFRLTGAPASFAVAPTTLTTVVWSAEDYDAFNVSTLAVFTVPTGWAGRWAFEWAVEFPGPSDGTRQVYLSSQAKRFGETTQTSAAGGPIVRMAGATSILMAVGDTASIVVYHTHSANLNINPSASQHFQGHYIGVD